MGSMALVARRLTKTIIDIPCIYKGSNMEEAYKELLGYLNPQTHDGVDTRALATEIIDELYKTEPYFPETRVSLVKGPTIRSIVLEDARGARKLSYTIQSNQILNMPGLYQGPADAGSWDLINKAISTYLENYTHVNSLLIESTAKEITDLIVQDVKKHSVKTTVTSKTRPCSSKNNYSVTVDYNSDRDHLSKTLYMYGSPGGQAIDIPSVYRGNDPVEATERIRAWIDGAESEVAIAIANEFVKAIRDEGWAFT